MRRLLRTGPWWAVGAVQGAVQRSDGWADATISGLVGGAFFGLISGLLVRHRRINQPDPLADLVEADRRRVERAAVRGPIPANPAERQAAAAHTRYQLELPGRGPRIQALVVVFLAPITEGVRRPQRLQRRLALLVAQDGDVGDAGPGRYGRSQSRTRVRCWWTRPVSKQCHRRAVVKHRMSLEAPCQRQVG